MVIARLWFLFASREELTGQSEGNVRKTPLYLKQNVSNAESGPVRWLESI
jgi:hypothetical protein